MEVITIESQAYQHLIKEILSLKKSLACERKVETPSIKTYTNQELADLLHVTTRYLQNCRNRGELSFVKIGTRVIYTQDHVDQFIKSNENLAFRKPK